MTTQKPLQHQSKTKLLDAALLIILSKGYAAMTVDEVCQSAGLTKGGFFHHFKGKEDLALGVAEHFAGLANGLFDSAPYHQLSDPLARLLGYVDFRIAILKGELPEFTCLFGMMVQELYQSHPAIREACNNHISGHAAQIGVMIAEAKAIYASEAAWSAESLGLFTQCTLQGAFILAKSRQSPQTAVDCLQHLRQYIVSLFHSHPV